MAISGWHGLEIDTPALLVDLEALESNISRMQSFFEDRKARLRPHFKTHKCVKIARMQVEAGAKGITCAKLGEAEVLVAGGIRDVLIANQIVGEAKMRRLAGLAAKADITVAVDDEKNVRDLSTAAESAGVTLGVLVEVDIGMGRSGVRETAGAVRLAKAVSDADGLDFRGLQGYEGHMVFAEEGEAKKRGIAEALLKLEEAKSAIEAAGIAVREVSGGGTGTYRVTGAHPVMTEIQVGSYATMDARYAGLVGEFRQALFCLVTVISAPETGRAIGDAGLKSLTSEFGMPVVRGREDMRVAKLSEEHTIFDVAGEGCEIGEKVLLVPAHGCTTINLHDELYMVRGGEVECIWPVAGRGKMR